MPDHQPTSTDHGHDLWLHGRQAAPTAGPIWADRRIIGGGLLAAVVALVGVGLLGSGGSDRGVTAADAATVQMTEVDPSSLGPDDGIEGASLDAPVDGLQDLDGRALTVDGDCLLEASSLTLGSSGRDVECLQLALQSAGTYTAAITGEFDEPTLAAVNAVQAERDLFVDGVVGRETALSLGIWPNEAASVVRTPAPAPGAVDLLGYPLSSVATSGPDAPPLPEGSGSGKRVVYERQGQRVWAVDSDDQVIRSWLVSGSIYSNELPGTHTVYSRSEQSWAWNMEAELPKMVRWLRTERGHIGFHGIPVSVEDGTAYQTDAELGTRLSGGCQRQANLDADFLWDFAPEGTTVVVL